MLYFEKKKINSVKRKTNDRGYKLDLIGEIKDLIERHSFNVLSSEERRSLQLPRGFILIWFTTLLRFFSLHRNPVLLMVIKTVFCTNNLLTTYYYYDRYHTFRAHPNHPLYIHYMNIYL